MGKWSAWPKGPSLYSVNSQHGFIVQSTAEIEIQVPSNTHYLKVAEYTGLPPTSFSMSANSSMTGLMGIYPYHTLAVLFFGCILFRQLKKIRNGNPKGLPLPPGPKGYPLIGNLFNMPIHKPWLVYDEWCKTYGKSFIINGLSTRVLLSDREC